MASAPYIGGINVASMGVISQIGGLVELNNPTAQPGSGLTLAGAHPTNGNDSYSMSSGAMLELDDASFTADAGSSFVMNDGSSFDATTSPIAMNCGSTATIDGGDPRFGDTRFTVIGDSSFSIGSPVDASAGPANVTVSNGGAMSIGGGGTIDMGYCLVEVSGVHGTSTIDTARTFNPVGTATNGAELELFLGNLVADGNNSTWIAAASPDSSALTVALDNEADINANGYNVTIAAPVTGYGELVKDGPGTLTLTAANSYTGSIYAVANTEVTAGILNIQNSLALGDSTMGVTVDSGATLQMQGGIAVAATGNLYLAGNGVGGIGAFDNVSGDNFWSGPIVLSYGSGDNQISSDADVLVLTGRHQRPVLPNSADLGRSGRHHDRQHRHRRERRRLEHQWPRCGLAEDGGLLYGRHEP